MELYYTVLCFILYCTVLRRAFNKSIDKQDTPVISGDDSQSPLGPTSFVLTSFMAYGLHNQSAPRINQSLHEEVTLCCHIFNTQKQSFYLNVLGCQGDVLKSTVIPVNSMADMHQDCGERVKHRWILMQKKSILANRSRSREKRKEELD